MWQMAQVESDVSELVWREQAQAACVCDWFGGGAWGGASVGAVAASAEKGRAGGRCMGLEHLPQRMDTEVPV